MALENYHRNIFAAWRCRLYDDDIAGFISVTFQRMVSGELLKESDYLLFAVADQPYLTAASVAALLEKAAPPTRGATLCFGEKVGSPTLFSASLAKDLRALEGDRGGRSVLRALGGECLRVQAKSARELEDIDLPEQLPAPGEKESQK